MSDLPVNTIKELDPDLRPQERALEYGVETLRTHELLALILRSGRPGHPITTITADLLENSSNSLHILGRKSFNELKQTNGLGTVKCLQVAAIMELAKRYYSEDNTSLQPVIRQSSDIDRLMRTTLGSLPQEEIWIVTLSRANRVINKHLITRGSAVASVFDLKRCLKIALLDDAQSLILCHNHPSGNLRPSPQDDNITRQLASACKQMELRLLDHVIFAHTGFYSYMDNGKLP
ncbi:MAG: DNA repair protein RadC [Muribaculaceae bacterium]|nr:DNA repair protein RadC [Muribaculaceae bacterium]